MFRGPSRRALVALCAGGIALSGCAAGHAQNAGEAPRNGAASPRSPAAPVPSVTATPSPVGNGAPNGAAAVGTSTPQMTASRWADMLAGGSVSTTAAAPAVTGGVPGLTLAVPKAPSAAKPAKRKTVYLTFDDGPGRYTPEVLRILARYDAKATFFIIGRQTLHAKATLRAEYDAGHGVANHTWDHVNLTHVSAKRFRAEVGRTQNAIKAATGHAPYCLRPPGGAVNRKVRLRTHEFHLHIQLWNLDTDDWTNPGAKKIAKRVVKHVHDGSVVLMHDGGGNRKQTLKALPIILRDLKAKGYTFAATCR